MEICSLNGRRLQQGDALLYLCDVHNLDGRQLSCFDMSALCRRKRRNTVSYPPLTSAETLKENTELTELRSGLDYATKKKKELHISYYFLMYIQKQVT